MKGLIMNNFSHNWTDLDEKVSILEPRCSDPICGGFFPGKNPLVTKDCLLVKTSIPILPNLSRTWCISTGVVYGTAVDMVGR